jgi:hypothetical protein
MRAPGAIGETLRAAGAGGVVAAWYTGMLSHMGELASAAAFVFSLMLIAEKGWQWVAKLRRSTKA